MKKYAIILSILTLIGLVLTVVLFTQEKKLDQTVFIQTTESIQNLQTLDKNLLVLLSQSYLNNQFNHDSLLDTSYQLSEEFSNLRYEALFEEIESSPPLSSAIENFDQHYASREKKLEEYIETNSGLAAALASIKTATDNIQALPASPNQGEISQLLGAINTPLFSLAINGALPEKESIENLVNELQVEAPTDALQLFSDYKQAVLSVLDNHKLTQSNFKALSTLDTGSLLDAIEKEYVNYHNQAIKGSQLFRNALIVYGIGLLGALIFFATQIRRNFLTLEQEVADRTQEIQTAYEDLQESQEQLIQSEKMASLGQMVAGVAHEINTPLGYVTSNISTLKLNVDELGSVVKEVDTLMHKVTQKDRNNAEVTQQLMNTLRKYKQVEGDELINESEQLLSDGEYGLDEISKLVISLKDFARLDRQAVEQVNIHDCIENSLTIASNHIKENNVNIERDFSKLPHIQCIPSKLNQLFLNIITNACQSMSDSGGGLKVSSKLVDEELYLSFKDQGVGMDEETQQKMFDPFFTSKEIGVGTGLGMSIAYKIVEAHNGRILVDSEPGKGTEMTVILPSKQRVEANKND